MPAEYKAEGDSKKEIDLHLTSNACKSPRVITNIFTIQYYSEPLIIITKLWLTIRSEICMRTGRQHARKAATV